MPSKKQRRRRDRTFRHDIPLVRTDEEGNEIEVTATEVRELKGKPKKVKADPSAKKPSRAAARVAREPSPPSWSRSLKRGGMFGGIIFFLVVFVMPTGSRSGSIVMGLFYALAFIPLTYWIDRLTYRTWQRRQARPE